jgi:hypothetical protein
MWNEIHYNLDDLKDKRMLSFIKTDIEKVLFPERFTRFSLKTISGKDIYSPLIKKEDVKNNPFKLEYYVKKTSSNIEVPEHRLEKNDEILSKRTSKSGNTIYNIKRNYNILYKRIIDTRNNKIVSNDLDTSQEEREIYWKKNK